MTPPNDKGPASANLAAKGSTNLAKLSPELARSNFHALLLANPNYFGTFPGLGEVVHAIQYNTTWEELACLGLNPGVGFDAEGTLEAVINLKQATGYDTGPCGSGSTEWVRFYVQNGTAWVDLGVTGVTVYDLAGSTFPVSYAVSVELDQVKKFCTVENVLNVRAILSWDFQPPANQPAFIPVWGNVVDARVQIAPALFVEVPIASLVGSGLVTIDPVLEGSVDLTESLPAKPQQPLGFAALKSLYANSKVPLHRSGFKEATNLASEPVESLISTANAFKGLTTSPGNLAIGSDLAAILSALEDTSGDTTYEELVCAGYNPQTRTLEAVIQIKLDSGYAGSLCTAGSYEYVSFYAFFGGAWNPVGAAQVNVHDLAAITPGNPINYAVFRLSNLYTEVCEGLEAIPLRAILSWQVAPTGPNFIPVWGNVLNTHVQPQIGVLGDGETARLLRVGEVGVIGIQSSSNPSLSGDWLANPTGVAGDCNNADDSPFGGTIWIDGAFTLNPAGTFNPFTGAVLPGAHPIIYQAYITPPTGPKYQLVNQFNLGVFPVDAPSSNPEVVIPQTAAAPYGPVSGGSPSALYYTYYESVDGQLVDPRTVVTFLASGLPDGNYTVEVDGFAWDGVMYQPLLPATKTFYVYNGYPAGGFAPEVSINLTSAADCGNITVGDVITGTYSVADDFFGSVTIALTQVYLGGTPIAMPTVYVSGANAGPDEVAYDGSNTYGASGTFTIYTGDYDPIAKASQTPLPACGYTIQLTAWDRALVGDPYADAPTCSGHYSQEAVGFCLVAPAS